MVCEELLISERWSTKAFTIGNMTPVWIFPVSFYFSSISFTVFLPFS